MINVSQLGQGGVWDTYIIITYIRTYTTDVFVYNVHIIMDVL